MNWDSVVEWVGILLLFCLVFGMSATVDINQLKQQIGNKEAILTGLIVQFLIMPLVGFWSVVTFGLDRATGITLLVITTSPGGSYSNWWCSMFNADLALSVTMTAISTIISAFMMPLNLYIYANYAFEDDIVQDLNWGSLIFALFIVIFAIGSGLFVSFLFREPDFNLRMNQLGNFSGLILVGFSAVMSNANAEARIYEREWQFYVGVGLPCIIGLIIANVISIYLGLNKPERVTVAVESCYQNVGIATTVALSMFNDYDQSIAVAVPFFYGTMEAMVLLVFCSVAWKAGWTKCPKDTPFLLMLATSYEVLRANHGDIDPEYQGYFVESHISNATQIQDAHKSPKATDLLSNSRFGGEFSPA